MERYTAAAIELVNFSEDVITASGSNETTINYVCNDAANMLIIFNPDGTREWFSPNTEEYQEYCG